MAVKKASRKSLSWWLKPVLALKSIQPSCSDAAFQPHIWKVSRRHFSKVLCFPSDTSTEGLELSSWLQASLWGHRSWCGFPMFSPWAQTTGSHWQTGAGSYQSLAQGIPNSFVPLMTFSKSWKSHFSPDSSLFCPGGMPWGLGKMQHGVIPSCIWGFTETLSSLPSSLSTSCC